MGSPARAYDVQRQRQLEEQVETLLGEVTALEVKLGDLHATDVSSLRREFCFRSTSCRRAYKSLAQHVQALDVESRHLPVLLERATEAPLTPDFVAQQLRLVAGVTAAVYGVGRLLRSLRIQEAGPVTAALTVLGGCYAGLRLVSSTLQRLGATARRRQHAAQELRTDLRALRERVQVMADLVDSGLRLHGMHPSQQHISNATPLPPPQQQQLWQAQQPWQPPRPPAPPPPPPSLYPAASYPEASPGAAEPIDDSGWG